MCGWLMGETFALGMLLNGDTPIFANAFLLVWAIGWTIGGLAVTYTILWQLMGREIIKIEGGVLKVEKSINGFGRKKQYEIKSIKNIDINPTQDLGIWGGAYNKNLYGMKSGKIKFDYGMKTIKIANDIDEAEARMLIEKLKENVNMNEENFA